MQRTILLWLLAWLLCVAPDSRATQEAYVRNPDLWGDRIVFTAEGDLWLVDASGGQARRLTTHPGDEAFARFSPDGSLIAFTGLYDGNSDVYVIPAGGGEPRRLTWHPAPDQVIGWTPDGKIIFQSPRNDAHFPGGIYFVDPQGGEPERAPIGTAVWLAVDPETGLWAFNRLRGGGTWKRYRGGTAPEVWVGDPQKADFHPVTHFDGLDAYPMWHGGRIYYVCDRGGTANIWSMLPDGSQKKRHTDFDLWDVRHPGMSPDGRIVFTLGASVHIFDPRTSSVQVVEIEVPSERILTRSRYPNPSRFMTGFDLAPDGERLAVVVRGEIFSVPVEEGVILPVVQRSSSRESRICFDPEGERIAYVTDASGEERLVSKDAWGRGEELLVSKEDRSRWHLHPSWSPDGEWIAYGDQAHDLWIVKAGGGKPHLVDHSDQERIEDYAWSPDGRWLAYSKANRVGFTSIFVYDVRKKETHQLTTWTTNDYGPQWDPKGRYLYFFSNRVINPHLGDLDFESIIMNSVKPYLILLRKDVRNPFAKTAGIPELEDAEDSEEDGEEEDEDGQEHEGEHKHGKQEKPKEVKIDFDGIEERFVEVPVDAGDYANLAAASERIYFLSYQRRGLLRDEEEMDEERAPKATLVAFDMKKKELKTVCEGVRAYDFESEPGKIAVLKARGRIVVMDAGPGGGGKDGGEEVSLSSLVLEVDPKQEWRQIFFEAWRQMRDFYWDSTMCGLDWEAVRDRYATLLPRLGTREDLSDLLAEMISELATSHTYVWGGDPGRSVEHRGAGLLGADLEREGNAFRIVRILRADPVDRIRSPLLEPGVDAREGEYIVSLNHRSFEDALPLEAYMDGLAGHAVLLGINDKPRLEGAREVVVEPIGFWREFMLRYADWVRRNREYVLERSGGRIGYVHIPDMGGWGLSMFERWFYPQLDLDGMIVDARWNGGGFVSQLVVSRLMRKVLWWDRGRWGDITPYPVRALRGPFVVLTNEYAASDGDIFCAAIKEAGIAPVIGKRSWGGVIGISASRRLVDGGLVTQPEFAWWHPRWGWAVENRGVEPDIEVENLPQDVARGLDAQLDRGIEEVLRLLEEHPPLEPHFAPAPVKSREAFRDEIR